MVNITVTYRLINTVINCVTLRVGGFSYQLSGQGGKNITFETEHINEHACN
jgi:hypothetical protein